VLLYVVAVWAQNHWLLVQGGAADILRYIVRMSQITCSTGVQETLNSCRASEQGRALWHSVVVATSLPIRMVMQRTPGHPYMGMDWQSPQSRTRAFPQRQLRACAAAVRRAPMSERFSQANRLAH
jgi:hypothetical protein